VRIFTLKSRGNVVIVFNCITGPRSEGVMINLSGMMKEAEIVVLILGGFNTRETTEEVKCMSPQDVCLYSPR
jgi:hypothetical protein